VRLYGTHHELPRVWSHTPFTHVVQIRRTGVAGHHDDRVAEVDDATLAVCEATIVKDLKEQRDKFARRLLDLVDSMRTMLYGLRRTYSVNWPPESCPM